MVPPSIRRAVRTQGPIDPSRPVTTVRASGPSLRMRRPPVRPEPPAHWTGPTWDTERGRWRPSPDDAMADWEAGRGAALDDLPKNGYDCAARHEGSGNACGFPLLANGMCVNQAEHAYGLRPASDPRGQISFDEQLANAGNPAARFRLEREREQASADAERDAAVAATAAEAEAAGPDAELERDVDLVEVAIRYEQNRQLASGAGAEQRQYKAAADADMRELLLAFAESGQLNISIVMPGSGENRVLTPKSKIWPKLLGIVDGDGHPVLDERDKPVTHSNAQRIEALRADGLDYLIEEKISTTGLNDLFGELASNEELAEKYPHVATIYELSYEWSVGSAKGRSGRTRTPTAREVGGGRRADEQ